MTPEPTRAAACPVPSLRTTQMLTFDPEAMTMALQDGVLEHVQLECGIFRGQIAHTAGAGSRVDWGRYALSLLARGDLAQDMVSITLALAGRGNWRVHGQGAASGDMVTFPECGELLVALPPQAQWLSVQVPRSRIEAVGLSPARCLASGARRLKGSIDAGLQQTLDQLSPVLAPHDGPSAFGAVEVELAHDELLAALFGEMARRVDRGDAHAGALGPGERWRVVRRAEEYLEAHDEPSVRIDDLCIAACTSLSRLERAFREVFGVSPRRFLMLRRLAAVRRELLRGDAGVSVTDIATRWGFFHLGRFSQEYRLLYGERPSMTLGSTRRAEPSTLPAHSLPRQ